MLGLKHDKTKWNAYKSERISCLTIRDCRKEGKEREEEKKGRFDWETSVETLEIVENATGSVFLASLISNKKSKWIYFLIAAY